MPDFLVLRCATCAVFCVQQSTVSGKWSCRLCRTRQSVVRAFLRSTSAAACRERCQALSLSAGQRAAAAAEVYGGTCGDAVVEPGHGQLQTYARELPPGPDAYSAWADYADAPAMAASRVDSCAAAAVAEENYVTSLPESNGSRGAKRQRVNPLARELSQGVPQNRAPPSLPQLIARQRPELVSQPSHASNASQPPQARPPFSTSASAWAEYL